MRIYCCSYDDWVDNVLACSKYISDFTFHPCLSMVYVEEIPRTNPRVVQHPFVLHLLQHLVDTIWPTQLQPLVRGEKPSAKVQHNRCDRTCHGSSTRGTTHMLHVVRYSELLRPGGPDTFAQHHDSLVVGCTRGEPGFLPAACPRVYTDGVFGPRWPRNVQWSVRPVVGCCRKHWYALTVSKFNGLKQ